MDGKARDYTAQEAALNLHGKGVCYHAPLDDDSIKNHARRFHRNGQS